MAPIFLAYLIGMVSAHWPRLLKDQWDTVLTFDEWKQQFPEMAWTRRIITLNRLLAIILFLIFCPLIIPFSLRVNSLFIIGFWFIGGGVSFLDSLVEIFAGISPMRRIVGKGHFRPRITHVALGKNIKLFGIVHLILTISVGLIFPTVIRLAGSPTN